MLLGLSSFYWATWSRFLFFYEQFSLLDSSPKAMIVMRELELAKSGKVDALIELKEIELNTLIYEHAMFLKEGKPWLIWPMAQAYDHAKYMKPVTSYRRRAPYEIEQSDFSDESTYQELVEAIDYVTEYYSEVTHNQSLKSG